MLECEDDDGTYELDQSSRTHRWCVFPNNGSEIPGSRVERPNDVDCDRFSKLDLQMHHVYIYTLHSILSSKN